MGLRGCVSVDSLALQILLRENATWIGTPVAVTKEERPQSPILALNREARERGLAVGMRYANALALVPGLRARAVSADRIAASRERIVRCIAAFTPDIEPCRFDVDAFWVNVEGLASLFASEADWSRRVKAALAAEGFHAVVVVGFTRFGTYAMARARRRSTVFASREEEHEALDRSPVSALPLAQRTKATLAKLEIRTVGQFVSLPEGETARRFGKETGDLRRAILSDDPLPIQPVAVREEVHPRRHLDAPLADLGLLMPHIEELLDREVAQAEAEHVVISGLTLVLRTEDGEVTEDLVRPAAPTLQTGVLARLVRLRLSAREFSSGVEDIEVHGARTKPSRAQEELFVVRRRDLDAGSRALAALRARFGNASVSRAELVDSWIPERSFRWEPLERPTMPSARGRGNPRASGGRGPSERPSAVRRIRFAPVPAGADPTGAGPHDLAPAAGPFALSGSWWGNRGSDAPFRRDYFYQRTPEGLLWIYVDRLTDTAWVQGVVD